MNLYDDKTEFKFGRSNPNYDFSDFYAFICTIEQYQDRRTIILFDSIETNQIGKILGRRPLVDEFESLSPRMIKCNFSQANYDAFKKMINESQEELSEGLWLNLIITDRPTRYRAEYIMEYFAGEPQIMSVFITEDCKKVDSQTQKQLEDLFDIERKESDYIKFERREKLWWLHNKRTRRHKIPKNLVVYDVGQGSMNALLNENGFPFAYFDVGGGAYWNAHTYPNPKKLCFNDNSIIILSHWDFDHWWTFNLLIKRNMINKKVKTTWIVPYQKLGTIQYKFYNLLKKNGHRIIVFPENSVGIFQFGKIEKCRGKNINDCGLVLKITIDKNKYLLPADTEFEWIPNLKNETYAGVVASHHGGFISDNLKEYPNPQNDNGKIVYSFGLKNIYHHPNGLSVILHSQAGWKNIKITPDGSVSFLSSTVRKTGFHGNCDLNIEQSFEN